MARIGKRIVDRALELLDANPEGIRYSELVRRIAADDEQFKPNTVHGNVWNLQEQFPDQVYKPSRGLFRLIKYRDPETDQLKDDLVPKQEKAFKEEDFYEPFAEWLVNEVEDCTKAIPLGGNRF